VRLAITPWIVALVLAGCYSRRAPEPNAPDSDLQRSPDRAGHVAMETAGHGAGEAPRTDSSSAEAHSGGAGATAGAGGCAANAMNGGDDDPAAFTGTGGAGAWLASTCARCGWPSRGDACQSLVYSVPTITDPDYNACFNSSMDFADCLHGESCICGGEVPRACVEIRARLDRCLASGIEDDPPDITVPADWIEVKTRCGFSFKAPYDYRDTPVQGVDSCIVQFAAGYCEYTADFGAFSGPFGRSDSVDEYHERSATIDGHQAQLVSFTEADLPNPFVAGAYFSETGNESARLLIQANCRISSAPIEAHVLFRTIEFARN
jgi:hypothetical protein